MWAGLIHLVIGNAFIGIGEGLILAWMFSLKKVKTQLVLIAANYFSAWVGGLLLSGAISRSLPMDLNNGWRWFWFMVFATYLITLVLEWPFVAFCLRGNTDWFRKSLKGNLVIQTASYVVLFGWYWMASGTSLFTDARVVTPKEMPLPESVVMYFISEQDGNVYARNLPAGDDQQTFALHSTNLDDRLLVRPSTVRTNSWDLVARMQTTNYQHPDLVEVKMDFARFVGPNSTRDGNPAQFDPTSLDCGEASRLGDAEKSDWHFETGYWAVEGLDGTNSIKHAKIHLSFETPFAQWPARNATHLPGDKVLFQLGNDQICLYDPNLRTIALLARGRGPVAALPKQPGE
jgi:hypothetical protein